MYLCALRWQSLRLTGWHWQNVFRVRVRRLEGGGGGGRVKFSLVADLTSDLTKVDGAQASKVAAALRGAFKC